MRMDAMLWLRLGNLRAFLAGGRASSRPSCVPSMTCLCRVSQSHLVCPSMPCSNQFSIPCVFKVRFANPLGS